MSDFLDQMAAGSRQRVAAARARESEAVLRARAMAQPPAPALGLGGRFDLIAELKLRSPALGALGSATDDWLGRVIGYARAGAAAVSVLTEPTRFDGSLAHLAAVARALAPRGVPAMRKDFLVDPYQLLEARAAGAGGVLLIVRMLDDALLAAMQATANELGLFVLLETFDGADIERAQALVAARPAGGAPVLVGVNSRDLQTLQVVPERLEQLAPLLPKHLPRVAESGLETPADCARLVRAGYDLALVGGALMTAPVPDDAVRAMLAAGREAA
jgi:indole-3-glycerol phosphate synthase